jgi:hypothetical protein
MRSSIRLICCLLALCFLVGCAEPTETSSESSPGQEETPVVQPANEVVKRGGGPIVFRARYSRERAGFHVPVKGGHAWPYEDGFSVMAVTSGKLSASFIQVRYRSTQGANYPRELTVGKVYALRLTPSARTKRELRENEKKGHSFLYVDGSEIEVDRRAEVKELLDECDKIAEDLPPRPVILPGRAAGEPGRAP